MARFPQRWDRRIDDDVPVGRGRGRESLRAHLAGEFLAHLFSAAVGGAHGKTAVGRITEPLSVVEPAPDACVGVFRGGVTGVIAEGAAGIRTALAGTVEQTIAQREIHVLPVVGIEDRIPRDKRHQDEPTFALLPKALLELAVVGLGFPLTGEGFFGITLLHKGGEIPGVFLFHDEGALSDEGLIEEGKKDKGSEKEKRPPAAADRTETAEALEGHRGPVHLGG